MAELSYLKPIETKYKGYKFRSRLEARWSVFFEEMGLDWSYEVEGFQLPSGAWYLPDFFIKSRDKCMDYWYEVKPKGTSTCPKVEEFSAVLKYEFISMSFSKDKKPQAIIQLDGEPMDFVKSLCPRCRKISCDQYPFDSVKDSWVTEYTCAECDKYMEFTHLYLEKFVCFRCHDIGRISHVLTEEDVNFGDSILWDNGVMKQLDEGMLAVLAHRFIGAKQLAREFRFDGRDSQ
jgi:hypothetical protein